MKKSSLLVLVLLLAAACNQPKEDTPTAGKLRAMTSESQAKVMFKEKSQFEAIYPDAHITLTSTTTRDAIVQLLNDSVRLICVDRALNPEENAVAKKAGMELQQIRIAEDALAVIVNPKNPMTQISRRTLSDIVSGRLKTWNTVPESKWKGSVELALTGRNSGTYELLLRHFLKLPGDAALSMLADSQQGVVQFVRDHPSGIGIVSVSAVRDTTIPVKLLEVEAIDSTGASKYVRMHQANIARELYPLHYPVYIYLNTRTVGVAMGFSTFIASQPGQQYFLDAGLVPKTQPVRLVQLHEE